MDEADPDEASAPNLILTGFMGTGKTTTARIVAERLGYGLVDTDALIEERHGPIPRIFTELGEERFREMEREVAAELSRRSGLVISTGGRMMLDSENAASLGATGLVICLVASPEVILERVEAQGSTTDRPLLSVPDPRRRVVELLAERAEGYGRFPQVDTDGRSPAQVADEVIAVFRRC